MALSTVHGVYDCNGMYAAGRSYVYVLMARDGKGPMYVKIGRSDNPVQRAMQVQVGCPFSLVRASMVKCLDVNQAKSVEAKMHAEFAAEASSGEWFRFDWDSLEVRENMAARFGMTLNQNMRKWDLEEIDLNVAAKQQRVLMAERKRRSRLNRFQEKKFA